METVDSYGHVEKLNHIALDGCHVGKFVIFQKKHKRPVFCTGSWFVSG